MQLNLFIQAEVEELFEESHEIITGNEYKAYLR
jgi:hypothetical protein